MAEIKEVSLNGKRIFYKETRNGIRIVYPSKIDGKIHWKNLIAGGSWGNLIGIAVIVGLILGSVWEYSQAVNTANTCLAQLPTLNIGF